MTSNAPRAERQRGQALLLGLAACAVLLALGLAALRGARALIERSRLQHRADVTAFSGAVDYARALNTLAYSEKALGGAYFASLALPAAIQFAKAVRKAQDATLAAGPAAAQASMAAIGWENGLVALPLWNGSPKGVLPSFNVVKRGPLEFAASILDKLKALTGIGMPASFGEAAAEGAIRKAGKSGRGRELLEELGYLSPEYSRNSRRGRIEIPKEKVYEERGRKGARYKEKGTHKYVKRTEKVDSKIPLDLDDPGGHSIALLALPRKGRGWAVAKVEVGGGNLDFWADESAEYGAYFVPLFPGKLPPLLH